MSDKPANPIALNLDLTLADHIKCEIFHSRLSNIFNVLFYVACILSGAAIGGVLISPLRFFLFLLLGLGCGVVAPVYELLRVCLMWFQHLLPRTMLVTISDSGLVYTIGDNYRETSDWSDVAIRERKGNFFLWSGKYHLPMPKRCFAAGQITDFVDALNRNLPRH